MKSLTDLEAARWGNSARLAVLLDKLVAVHMDLEPVCGPCKERAQIVAPIDTIAEACDVLRSAIADVRNIIHQVDGLMPEAAVAQVRDDGWALPRSAIERGERSDGYLGRPALPEKPAAESVGVADLKGSPTTSARL